MHACICVELFVIMSTANHKVRRKMAKTCGIKSFKLKTKNNASKEAAGAWRKFNIV